jgi:ubiquinone/menaquinone biosynthesis C-methylase UbiE
VAEGRWSVPGAAYSAQEWLDNHHAIKSRLRSELIAKLPIFPGDRVVDLGCATGNWSFLLADRVGVRGTVIGIDWNATSLAVAEQRRHAHVLGRIVEFKQAKLEDVVLADGSVDVLLLFNVLSYVREPTAVIDRLIKGLRPGGRLIIKDTDLQGDFFWPVPFDVYARAMECVAANQGGLIEGNYDPFFARRIPALLRGYPQLTTTTLSQSFSFFAPLSAEEREYVRANAVMIGELAARNGGIDAADRWYSLFAETNPDSALNDPNFMFSMNEFIFQAVLN